MSTLDVPPIDWPREVTAILEGLGRRAIRVREGGGPENLAMSLAVTVAGLARTLEKLDDGSRSHCPNCQGRWFLQPRRTAEAVITHICEHECGAFMTNPMCLPEKTSSSVPVADAFEEVLRVEIASDTPEKVQRFRKELCNLILDAPAAGNHDAMVTIYRGDSIPVFETNRSPKKPTDESGIKNQS